MEDEENNTEYDQENNGYDDEEYSEDDENRNNYQIFGAVDDFPLG